MQAYVAWWIVAAVLVGVELARGTFYLLVYGVAAAVAGVAAWLGAGMVVQPLTAAVIGAAGIQAVNLKVADKYVEAFSGLAETGNTLIVPSNMADISSLIAGAMSVVKSQSPERTGQA